MCGHDGHLVQGHLITEAFHVSFSSLKVMQINVMRFNVKVSGTRHKNSESSKSLLREEPSASQKCSLKRTITRHSWEAEAGRWKV